MRHAILPLLLALACADSSAEPDGKRPVDTDLKLPAVAKEAADKKTDDHEEIVINLNGKGEIRCTSPLLTGKELEHASLGELSTLLRHARDDYALVREKQGKSGVVPVARNVKASALHVTLRIDETAPWQHAQWLMTTLAEMKFFKLRLAGRTPAGEVAVEAHLPTDTGVRPIPREPPNEILASVHIVGRKEMPAQAGDRQVSKPTEFFYRMGGNRFAEPAEVAKRIVELKQAAKRTQNAYVVGEIKAGHKVPFGQLLPVLAEFRKAGIERVQFFGTRIPDAAERKAKQLPYPRKNY